MSTIKSSDEHLTLNADGSSKDIKFQANGVEKASISSAGVLSSDGGSTHADNVKAKFGTGNDLEIYHDGTDSYIKDTGSGDLYIQGSSEVQIESTSGENMVRCVENGAVELFHNNVKKFETAATGINLYPNTNTRRFTNRIYNEGTDDSNVWSSYHSGNGNIREVGMEGSKVRFYTGAESGTSTSKRFEIGVDGRMTAGDGSFAGGSETLTLKPVSDGGANDYVLMLQTDTNSSATIIRFFTPSGVAGVVSTSGSNTSYGTSSDYRLKENVDYDWDATTRLKQLKPARFNWIADETNTLQDGFIAHEVSSVVPEAISGEKDATETYTDDEGNERTRLAPQSIDQAKLVPLLVKTIQELEARITALEA